MGKYLANKTLKNVNCHSEYLGEWKIAEAELGGKTLPADTFGDLMLDLDETSYQIIVQTVIEICLIELIQDADPPVFSITPLFGDRMGKIFHCK